MPRKTVTFIGNPNSPADAKPYVTAFGETYMIGQPREVELTDAVVRKLSGNAHFLVEDVGGNIAPSQTEDVPLAEMVLEPLSVEDTPEPASEPEAEVSPPVPSPAPVEDASSSSDDTPAPIEVRRARSRRSAK